jgi:hypothetical protein
MLSGERGGEEKPRRRLVRNDRDTVVRKVGGWKGAATQIVLEPGSRGIAIARSRYQATTSEDTADWKSLSVYSN